MGQIVFVQVGDLCQTVQGDVLPVVGVQIPLDLGTLPVLCPGGLLQLQRKGGAAHQPDQQYLQQVLTDCLTAVQAAVGLCQQHVQQSDHPLPVLPAVEDGVGGVGLAEQELHAGYPQHDILQGGGVEAQLGVLHLGVHDDHVVGLYRKQLPGKVELTLAAEAVEQLSAGVGVGGAVPVAAKPAFADVQQPEGLPGGRGVLDVKALGAHNTTAPLSNAKNIKIKTR